jgi:hypothetical protein
MIEFDKDELRTLIKCIDAYNSSTPIGEYTLRLKIIRMIEGLEKPKLEPVPENEILLGRISALQSEVNNLKWRMKQVWDTLALKEKTGWNASLTNEGTKPCDHMLDPDNRICMTCHEYVPKSAIKDKCEHKSNGDPLYSDYLGRVVMHKCRKCGEFYE